MEQKAEQPRRAAAALVAVLLVLSAVLLWPVNSEVGELSTPTAGTAVLELTPAPSGRPAACKVGTMVIPLGRTVGIKLFSDGVLVVGLSDIQTEQKTVSPAKDMGLKVGDVITVCFGNRPVSVRVVSIDEPRGKDVAREMYEIIDEGKPLAVHHETEA